jgi:DNA-directed RNA polymerase subunit RPC12/RpoP
MSNVLEFPKRKPDPAPEPDTTEYIYFCMKCEGGLFKIRATGAIVCNGCGSTIRTIEARRTT